MAMSRADYDNITSLPYDSDAAAVTVSVADIDGADRTLAYGYTCTRASFHVYLRAGEIHRVIYNGGNGQGPARIIDHIHGPTLPAERLRPDKRVYPESTDADFALLMRRLDLPLTMLRWNDERAERVAALTWHGHVVADETQG